MVLKGGPSPSRNGGGFCKRDPHVLAELRNTDLHFKRKEFDGQGVAASPKKQKNKQTN